MISAILASTSSGGIGNRGTLPWPNHSEDLKWFAEHTTGNIVVMGRRTWDDPKLPKPLPNRVNCVISNTFIDNPDVRRLHGDIKSQVLELQSQFPDKNVFIIGGKTVYDACEDIINKVYLTRMKGAWFTDTRINLDRMLMCFRIKTVRPGNNCTYEIWDRVLF
jgi:dihydrofolate reductase